MESLEIYWLDEKLRLCLEHFRTFFFFFFPFSNMAEIIIKQQLRNGTEQVLRSLK